MKLKRKWNFLKQELAESEVLEEATKYVLKQNKPAPMPVAPAVDEPVAPLPADAPAEPVADAPLPDEGGGIPDEGGEDPNDYMKVLKKLAGKLQEKINKYEDRLESSDYKEIIKQILSAVDLEKLDESDIEEILSVFEADDTVGDMGDGEPVPAEDTVEPIEASETDEIDGIASLDELINTPLDEFDEFDDDYEEDDMLASFDDTFDDEEIKKAERVAKKDQGDEFGNVNFSPEEIDSFPIYGDDESDLEEELPIQGMGEETPGDEGMGSIEDVDDVRELDLDELTNMVNSSVKETLGKYFE